LLSKNHKCRFFVLDMTIEEKKAWDEGQVNAKRDLDAARIAMAAAKRSQEATREANEIIR